MTDEATRRQWREYKRKWRAANPERNRELDSKAYYRHRDTINQKRKEMRALFTEWRRAVHQEQAQAHAEHITVG